MLNRLLKCKKSSRCGLIHVCNQCADNYQKKKFAMHTKELDYTKFDNFFYVVVGSKTITTLRENLEEIKSFLVEFSARKNRKRGIFKTAEFFIRLEVSFRAGLGFYPHINIMFFNVDKSALETELYNLCVNNSLKYRSFSKDNNENTIKSVLWYILKFNKMEWKKMLAVQVATKGFQEIRYSSAFKYTDLNKFDDEILPIIDMSFIKPKRIRSSSEVSIYKKIKDEQKKLNEKKKNSLKNLRRCACGCGMVLDTKRKYYCKECMLKHHAITKIA